MLVVDPAPDRQPDVVVLDDRAAVPEPAPPRRDRAELARRSGRRRGRSSPRSPSPCCSGRSSCGRGWKPEYVLPVAGDRVRPARRADRRRHRRRRRSAITMRRAAVGFALALVIGVARRRRRRLVEDRPLGGRLADHRPADDAVDRLVPAGHPAVPAVRGGDHVRRRARRRAVDRQRADRRRRPRAADPAAGRAGDGRRPASTAFRHVVLPASLPSFVGGLKQGWAFAWRSLMAGELLVTLGVLSVGFLLQQYRNRQRLRRG